jgi:hypothetical protein
MKLWRLNKYWMSYGILVFSLNVVSLVIGLNTILSFLVLGVFGFGCLLALASLYKLVDGKVNPKPHTQSVGNEALIDIVFLRDKDLLRFQVSPDAPFSWFIQKVKSQGGGENYR